MEISVKEMLSVIDQKYIVEGNQGVRKIVRVDPIGEATDKSLVWIKKSAKNKTGLLKNTKAKVVICDQSVVLPNNLTHNMCLIKLENPKLAITQILNAFFVKQIKSAIHPSAIIHPEAIIQNNVYIGPNSYIGACEIGENTIIEGCVYVFDQCVIKKNVKIKPGAIIGSEGFGYSKDDQNKLLKFPHVGSVIIEDNVEIGANTCIDRGSLGKTIIKANTKINNLVHIAHNVVVGKGVIIAGLVNVSGSSTIGDNTWIGPGATIRNSVLVGKNVIVGMGAVVVNNIPDNATVIGNPAREAKKTPTNPLL